METKTEKFERVLGPRLEKACHQINLMNNLTDTRAYDSTPERRREVVERLQKNLDGLASAFGVTTGKLPAEPPQVTLPTEPAPEPMPDLPVPGKGPICQSDRDAIRDAMRRAYDGDVKGGLAAIAHVMRGWPVDAKEDAS